MYSQSMRKILIGFLFLFFFLHLATPSLAATKKPTSAVSVSPLWYKTRGFVRLTFSNLKSVSRATYTLTYKDNGIDRGVMGSVSLKKPTFSRDIIIGTCSSGVCRYYWTVKKITVQVDTLYKNGSSTSRKYILQ